MILLEIKKKRHGPKFMAVVRSNGKRGSMGGPTKGRGDGLEIKSVCATIPG